MNVRSRWVDSLLGPLQVRRHYYHCRRCRHGLFPRDKTLGLGKRKFSPAAAQVVSITGVQTSFAQSSEVTLRKLCGLKVSESTVERVTEDAGERLQTLLAAGETFGNTEPFAWQRDAHGKTCAYVSLDATGVRQQGPRGAQAEGRMAYVGMIYNINSEQDARSPDPHSVRYLSGFYELPELGRQLRRQAAAVGWDEAEQQIAISDGGAGLEEFLRVHFPRAERILDFWHASEYLVELSQSLYPDDEEHRTAQLASWCHRLKHQGGLSIVWMLQSLEKTNWSSAQREAYTTCLRYFQNHQHKMNYPRYVAHGWQIGSGPVESACKTVVAGRLKQSGMRWSQHGSNAVCHLRALYLSQRGCWEDYWQKYAA
ncbi:ISKra4 family transposase [Aeoliella mucimassa]|uniref:ISKra4 family transposase n=1 Tax=Aeoliella mucimassa TaxID=2527972 RepID=A0A518ARD3_9BACT|nr:ISKra4 family transposase [Aeoliella mucimassa]QDU53871.1 hypothetical protein Pan181_00490 [Aeoliella mucimassa]QDU56651.1 hypothetical protein Pan181_28610 [Aeoliella mucimassa]QDU57279.1 hypothetical protein Pan181_34940 [Aeoliella mucimassa]QDU57698.1 hypothetical protein Pan181_39200 [Aeoliella mucimassa]